MFEIRDGYVEDVLQLLRDAEVFDDVFGLLTEVAVDGERLFSVDVGHFEVVFYVQPKYTVGRQCPQTAISGE